MKVIQVNDGLVSIAAWGDHHADVPEGYVVVEATPGGVRGTRGTFFLLKAAEYSPGMSIVPQLRTEAKGFVPFDREAFIASCRSSSSREAKPQTQGKIDPTGHPAIKGSSAVRQLQPAESASPAGTAQPWSAVLKTLGCLRPDVGARRVRSLNG